MLALQGWPSFDPAKCIDESVDIAVQVCGKLRGVVRVAAQAGQDEAYEAALGIEKVAGQLSGLQVVKIIYVKGKLINIVAK
jgi:leucyl-tRNA synthetase